MTLPALLYGAPVSNGVFLLLESALKGTIVLALAFLLVFLLRRASAAHRHLVWACALAGLVALPALLTLPAWSVSAPALAWLAPASHSRTQTADPSAAPARVALERERDATGIPSSETAATTPQVSPAPSSESNNAFALPAEARDGATHTSPPWYALAFAFWAIGALAVFAVFLAGHLELRSLQKSARTVRDGEWQALALESADRLGLKAPFTLLRGDGVAVPLAFGLLRPRVLLPAGSDDWPRELRSAVLLHELAHVQRHDCLTQALAQVACVLFWFHPAVWWAASRLHAERERACDDRVLAARTRPSEYADHLLGMVRSLRTRRLSALGGIAFARPSSLEGRLLAVLDPRRDRRSVHLGLVAPAALASLFVIGSFAAFEPVQAYTVVLKRGHEIKDPDALRPSRVVPVPGPEKPLGERVAWASADARRSGANAWWIGWRVEVDPSMKGNLLSDSEGISLDVLNQTGLFTLEDVISGRAQGTSNGDRGSSREEAKPTALLIRMEGAGPARIRVQSLSLPAEFAREPLYWMDQVQDEQAFAWLREAAGRARGLELKSQFVESIGFMGRSELVVPFLRSTLEGNEPERVRVGAAEALGHHPSPETVRLLASHARKDRFPEVRRASVEALGHQQTPEALEELLKIARSGKGNELARRAAYDAIGEKISSRAVAEENFYERGDGPQTDQGPQGPQGPQGGQEPRVEDPEDTDPGEIDVNVDSDQDEPSSPMAAADFEVQRQAVEALGRYPEAQSLPQLKRIAETSPYGELRGEAVESIGRLGTTAALALLDQIAWKNTNEEARQRAVEVLGRHYPADAALEKLSAVARSHPSFNTRRMAVEMIGRVDSPRSEKLLNEIIEKSMVVDCQRQAVESLGRREGSEIDRRLMEIARTHKSVEVRRQAVESIGRRVGDHTKQDLLALVRAEVSEEVQRQAVESLGRLQVEVMPDLAQIARTHPSSGVRREAVESMVRRDSKKALPLLEEILRQP